MLSLTELWNKKRKKEWQDSYEEKTYNDLNDHNSNSSNLGMTWNNRLPIEILILIFEYVSLKTILTCSNVCKSWYQATLYSGLYEQLTFNTDFKTTNEETILQIINRGKNRIRSLEINQLVITDKWLKNLSSHPIFNHLQSLKLIDCKKLTCKSLFNLLYQCQTQLNYLELHSINLDFKCSKLIWTHLSHLITLRLYKVHFDLSSLRLSEIFKLTSMNEFTLVENTTLDDPTLMLILKHITPDLSILKIRKCTNLSERIIHTIASTCTKLNHLDISEFTLGSHFSSTSLESDFATIAYTNPSLLEIHLNGSIYMSDTIVEQFSILCSKLKMIDLGSSPHLTNKSLIYLSTYCQQLEVLYIQDAHAITHVGILHLSKKCIRLKQLYLNNCHITDSSLRLISSLKFLHYLSLDSSSITSSVLLDTIRHLRKLEYLSIKGCPSITNEVLFIIKSERPKLILSALLREK
jgi:hypothetical protein